MIQINVNGKNFRIEIDPDTPLLWVLRDHLKLTGTKYSCGIGECGACTVHVDGQAVQSCVETIGEVQGQQITTIEGLKGEVADALFESWIEGDVPQCGFCQPAQIMQASELLQSHPKPTDMDIDKIMSTVLCRCGTYQHIRQAIHRAAKAV